MRTKVTASITELKTVLLFCTGNPCCVQMAETMLNHILSGQIRALSIAPRPQPTSEERAIEALKLAGFAPDSLRPRDLDEVVDEQVDLIIVFETAVSARLPSIFRSVPRMRIFMEDLQGAPLANYIRARNEIRDRLIPIVRTALEI